MDNLFKWFNNYIFIDNKILKSLLKDKINKDFIQILWETIIYNNSKKEIFRLLDGINNDL